MAHGISRTSWRHVSVVKWTYERYLLIFMLIQRLRRLQMGALKLLLEFSLVYSYEVEMKYIFK